MVKHDLKNKKFGRLTVIDDVGKRTSTGRVKWLCLCECGNETFVEGQHLTSGRTKSCGCLNDEKRRTRFKDLSNYENENFKVIEKVENRHQKAMWLCVCKHCGNEVTLNSVSIEKNKSCGCMTKRSDAEYMQKIADPDKRRNNKPTKRSTTGIRGVYFNKHKGVYQAFINVDKKTVYLGSSRKLKEAAKLRREAELKYGYENKK